MPHRQATHCWLRPVLWVAGTLALLLGAMLDGALVVWRLPSRKG